MKKSKTYRLTYFTPDTIRQALNHFQSLVPKEERDKASGDFKVQRGDENWDYDSVEEALSDYRKGSADLGFRWSFPGWQLSVYADRQEISTVTVGAKERRDIESTFEIFERGLSSATHFKPKELPAAKCRIFIGHGHSPLWQELLIHLQNQHGFSVEAYETGARAGHTIRDILDGVLERTDFAVLILTAEDLQADGTLRARQNAIHETGLFQGRLGFERAIVLLEDGCEEFSNLAGVQQLRFSAGRIKETYGDLLATIRREFGKKD